MGEAKRRGNFEERKANAIVRRHTEEARRAEQHARMAEERRRQASERQKLLSPQERKEAVLLGGGGHDARLMLAAMLGFSAPLLALPSPNAALGDSQGEPK